MKASNGLWKERFEGKLPAKLAEEIDAFEVEIELRDYTYDLPPVADVLQRLRPAHKVPSGTGNLTRVVKRKKV